MQELKNHFGTITWIIYIMANFINPNFIFATNNIEHNNIAHASPHHLLS